jgi:peptide/nickel transport system substrate-binding protein
MRQKPIGTGPFKVVEFKANHVIRLAKNRDYWKRDRPYLDGLEYRIMPSQATRILEFISGQSDVTGGAAPVTANGLKDIRARAPKAVCETNSGNVTAALLINTKAPPFDNPKLRRAISFALDRTAFVKVMQGDARLGGIIMSPPVRRVGSHARTARGGARVREGRRAQSGESAQDNAGTGVRTQ